MGYAPVTLSSDEKEIKLADCKLVEAAGGLVAAGLLLGMSKSTLHELLQLDCGKFIRAVHRQKLEDVTRQPHFTRYSAERQGYVLVRLPEGDVPTGATFHTALSDHCRTAAELTAEMVEALHDMRVELREAEAAHPKCIAVAQAAMRLARMMEQIMGDN
jgi:hypothetical protein